MKNFLNALVLSSLAIIFIACAPKNPTPSLQNDNGELKLVLIRSKDIKFYDFGVLQTSPEIKLDIFKLGKFLGSFVIKNDEICFKDDCGAKQTIIKKIFGKASYDTLLDDILLKKDIFDGLGKTYKGDTIIQSFEYNGEKIDYERSPHKIYFNNLTNGVLISIEDYKATN